MGPKPFQAKSANQEFSFDKVFSVPVAPSKDTNGHYVSNENVLPVVETNTEISPAVVESFPNHKEPELVKSDSSSIDEDTNSSDSGYKPKTPSTAERRRLFEAKPKDDSPENEDLESLEKNHSNRNSIAERRKVYESRSMSSTESNVSDKTSGSPTPVRRKDSFKSKKDICKDEENKKVPALRQQSTDTLDKPEVISTPTPTKRTSTVFGKVHCAQLYLKIEKLTNS